MIVITNEQDVDVLVEGEVVNSPELFEFPSPYQNVNYLIVRRKKDGDLFIIIDTPKGSINLHFPIIQMILKDAEEFLEEEESDGRG